MSQLLRPVRNPVTDDSNHARRMNEVDVGTEPSASFKSNFSSFALTGQETFRNPAAAFGVRFDEDRGRPRQQQHHPVASGPVKRSRFLSLQASQFRQRPPTSTPYDDDDEFRMRNLAKSRFFGRPTTIACSGSSNSHQRFQARRRREFSSPDDVLDVEVDLDSTHMDLVAEDYTCTVRSLFPQLSINRMDPMSQVFCLRWNNHRNNLLTVFDHLLETESFCDVTLACEDASVKCHKMILSASSTYFQSLFLDNSCEHPIVFLKDIKYGEIKTILDYMYKGEVNVAQEELPGLLKVAELLKVKGLVEEERERLLNPRDGRGPKGGNDVDHSPSKINGDEHHNHPRSKGRNAAAASERDSFRDGERDRHERSDSRTGDNDGRERDASRESKDGPLTPNGNGPSGVGIRPFMYTPPPGAPHFPMFPGLSNIFPGAHSLFGRRAERGPPSDDRDAGHNGNDREDVAGLSPQHGNAKRKKMESGSGGSSSSKESREGGDGRVRDVGGGGGSIRCRDDLQDDRDQEQREREEKLFRGLPDADALKETSLLPLPPGIDKSNIANYVPNQRLEWKRYKQYTRNDIMAAIEEVKKGMSALQASRKYNVPSRTLYDKVKKMGITTGRQMQRNKSLTNYPPSFSGMSLLGNDYKNLDDREDSNDNSFVSSEMDGRATMVPPTGLSTLRMLNMLNSERGGKGDGDRFTPMNLSSMLSNVNARSRDVNKITSDSSLSPHSPREHEREEDVGRGNGDIADEDERDGAADSSGGGVPLRNDKHLSDEVRAQVFADLRRFRGGIPNTNGGGDQQATSTTKSPPPPTSAKLSPMSNNAGGSSTATRSISREDNLPPRKRKVSQEHHSVMECIPAPTAPAYNGMHEDVDDDEDLVKQADESPLSDSSAASPDKPRNDEEPTSRILDCRN